jgi:5-oxoprolinase (ATP-hydrolysing) subunit A
VKKVDLNVDIGEGFPHDKALLEFATSANVCCGEHAGSFDLTQSTVALCLSKGVRVGAHPGFPDRESMGRRTPSVEELGRYLDSLKRQVTNVSDCQYVKPHGAFYNILVGELGGLHSLAWEVGHYYLKAGHRLMLLNVQNLKVPVITEGFADRAYQPNGTLVPRTEPGAVLHDPDQIRRQVVELAPKVDSICLHGDTPDCLEFAEMVYKTLVDKGYEVGY